MVVKAGSETLREVVNRKAVRKDEIRREVLRLEAVIQAAVADCEGGDVEKGLDRLLDEVASWNELEEDWSDSPEVQEFQAAIVASIGTLTGEGDYEPGDEDEGEGDEA